jgi:hypothetical protein
MQEGNCELPFTSCSHGHLHEMERQELKHMGGRRDTSQWNQPDILNTKEKQHQCVTLMMLKALEAMCEKFKKQECHTRYHI